jgi:hypothetical protein
MAKKKRGPGQPAKPDAEKRKGVMVRFNDKEKKKIERLARKADLPVATFIRKSALGEIGEK